MIQDEDLKQIVVKQKTIKMVEGYRLKVRLVSMDFGLPVQF